VGGSREGLGCLGPPPLCPSSSLSTRTSLAVGTSGCEGGAESWQLWASLPREFLVLLGLFPNRCSPRREPDPAQKWDSCNHCWDDALALLPAQRPQLCSPSTKHELALGLKEELNWAGMFRAADAGRELRAGKRSRAGRKERVCFCFYSFSRYFFLKSSNI